MTFEEVVVMASLMIGKSKVLLLVLFMSVVATWLLSPDAVAGAIEYLRGGGGLDVFTP